MARPRRRLRGQAAADERVELEGSDALLGTFTILAVVVGLAILLAKFVDSRDHAAATSTPAAETRYRVLRRSLMVGIVFVALLAALLVIPQVRASPARSSPRAP